MIISNLQILLQEAIDDSTRSVDHLLLARAIESLRMGQIRTVATFVNLPSASANEGLLVFVEDDERVYFSNEKMWLDIINNNQFEITSWGDGTNGQLGDGTLLTKTSPVNVLGSFTDWCQISAGSAHSLGLRTNGSAWAWGVNTDGTLGDGTIISRSSPIAIISSIYWCQISGGGGHSLAIKQKIN